MHPGRLTSTRSHNDGQNAWHVAQIAPPAALAPHIQGYGDYTERTGTFTTRRELPHPDGVLIVNLGSPIAITGGDGAVLHLGPGEAFVAGAHLRPALSHSNGAQSGLHVYLPLTTLRRVLAIPMHHLIDRAAPLDALLGRPARDLGTRLCEANSLDTRIHLIDAALSARLAETPPIARQQAHALQLLRHRPNLDIAGIARDLGWSRKHLASRVQDAVGVGPRSFRRLLRFQKLTTLIAGPGGRATAGSTGGRGDPTGLGRSLNRGRLLRSIPHDPGIP
jgi:AraC-like DNA-binding protein